MKSILELPATVISCCNLEPTEFRERVSQHLFAQVLAQADDHWLVRYLNHWSLRRTQAELKANMTLRWFVGCLVNTATPSYVTLQRFEAWVK
ncbi:MAG: transposase [Anaerolineales bacterium]|nr:transposase [Anaerolineales bacterium]